MTALPVLERSMPTDLDTLVGNAYELCAVLEGLDVVHVTAHVTGADGGAYPKGASEIERRAQNALGPMIQMALRMALDLAEGLDISRRAHDARQKSTGH